MDIIEQVWLTTSPCTLALGCVSLGEPSHVDLQGDAEGFAAYLEKYGNTICGRHPIGILLNVSSSSFSSRSKSF